MRTHTSTCIPSYRLHKPKGLAVVRLGGRDIYLGKHGSPESHAEYRRVIAEWLASGKTAQFSEITQSRACTVNELVLAYVRHAASYYVKNGRPTGESENIKHAVRPLVLLYGHTPVTDFGPLSLKAVRQSMVDSGLSRGVTNQRINRVRRTFKWGVESQLVPASVLEGLKAVAPLKRGRCAAREAKAVVPIADVAVDAVIAVAPPLLAAMIELQRLTGMRPGEVVLMRTGDIDRTSAVWVYVPSEHKTEHHERQRVVYFGPQAQSVLCPYLKADSQAFIFCPQDVASWRARTKRAKRVTPLTPSQRARTSKAAPKREPGERYTTLSYARAIGYACDLAFPHPVLSKLKPRNLSPEQRQELEAWRRKHRWSPNRLRHNAATSLRKQFGLEAARVVLGHSSAAVTEIYAERDMAKAAEIMGKVG